MRTCILLLIFAMTLSTTSCTEPDLADSQIEIQSPEGDDGEVKDKPGNGNSQ